MTEVGPSSDYTEKDITVLEGLEPVRVRPAMYIGGTGIDGLHHLLWEIVDNSVDEAINGYASTIEVTLHEDGESLTVSDNGRGIPVGWIEEKQASALQLILTTLHAGGKFDSNSYKTSGGLHGVGSSVVNALSIEMIATIKRDGLTYRQSYSCGVPLTDVEEVGPGRGTGTEIFFRPDDEIFESIQYEPARISAALETKAYLNAGLRIVFRDRVSDEYHEFKHDGGVKDYLGAIQLESRQPPIHTDIVVVEGADEDADVQRLELALQWTEDTRDDIRTFANGVPTSAGGTHDQGFKDGVNRALRSFMDTHALVPKSLSINSEDIREGLKAIVSVYLSDPQFQGQTKAKLNNPSVRSAVSSILRMELEEYLNTNISTGQAIVQRIVQAAKARQASRAAAHKVTRKRAVSRRLNLPGKLSDCSSADPEDTELFIVEGDSAGGNAKQGRDRRLQAILPLRGKVLNAEQASLNRVAANKELSNIVDALGCGLGENFDASKLRYHKIILLMDADSDGHHISTLLLTFFYRYMPKLIEGGFLYIAQPPLYRIDFGSETFWELDDADRDRRLSFLRRRKRQRKINIQRFKGLGEMMAKTLKETTLDPENRRLLQVTIPEEELELTDEVIGHLMGRDASRRFDFIMNNAANVDEEELDL